MNHHASGRPLRPGLPCFDRFLPSTQLSLDFRKQSSERRQWSSCQQHFLRGLRPQVQYVSLNTGRYSFRRSHLFDRAVIVKAKRYLQAFVPPLRTLCLTRVTSLRNRSPLSQADRGAVTRDRTHPRTPPPLATRLITHTIPDTTMNTSRRGRTSSKNPLRQPQIVRRRSSRLHRPLTEYIRSGARAVSDALNAITTVFAPVHNSSRNMDVIVRFEREQTPEGDFHEPAVPVAEDGAAPNNTGDGDNAGAGLHNQPGAQPQPQATPVVAAGLIPIPIARRAIRRRDGSVVQPAQPWQEPVTIAAPRTLQDAGFQPASPPRRAPLRREGAFHEDTMPLDAPSRQNVFGRDPSTLYENLVWEAQWGPIPRLADVAGNGDVPPTTHQVLAYLNDRFRSNRRAYNTALDVLFPPEGREPREPAVVRGEPAFQRLAPTALWRLDSDWEGGVVPVDREWGMPQADDAADPEAQPFDPAEYAYSHAEDDMTELTDEELLAIQAHISACLASRQARISDSVFPQPSSASLAPSSPVQSYSMLTSLPGPSSITPSRSSPSHKAARGKKGAHGTRNAASTSSAAGRPPARTRRQLSSTLHSQSRTQAFASRLDRRNVARARLQDTIRKNLKKRELARKAASSSRRSSPRTRPQTRASTARSSPPSPRTPAPGGVSPSRQLRSQRKRSRGDGQGDAVASPERDDAPRSKRARTA